MIARSPCRCRDDCKAKPAEIKHLDKGLDHPRRIVAANIVFQRSRQPQAKADLGLAVRQEFICASAKRFVGCQIEFDQLYAVGVITPSLASEMERPQRASAAG